MANSSAVTAGDQATAAQYNALRADVLAGHFHDGVEGAAILSILFGDGSDGDVTISANSTLTRDMRYRNLTVNAGVTLEPGGYRIFVSGTLTLAGKIGRAKPAKAGNGAVGVVGGSAAGGSGGQPSPAYTVPVANAGQQGMVGMSGYNSAGYWTGNPGTGAAALSALGWGQVSASGKAGDGGAGGNSGSYLGASGGVSGASTFTFTPPSNGGPFDLFGLLWPRVTWNGANLVVLAVASTPTAQGGSSGGQPGATNSTVPGSGSGGGGGAEGSAICAFANVLTGAGSFEAPGGDGGDGGAGGSWGTNAGGGGGGGGGAGGAGGVAIVVYRRKSGWSGTYGLPGGAGGAGGPGGTKTGSGVNGSAGISGATGGTGRAFEVQV